MNFFLGARVAGQDKMLINKSKMQIFFLYKIKKNLSKIFISSNHKDF
jgi:hypothetical protein